MASESDQEYIPSDLDEEAFLNHTYGTDEEAYLQGATTGEDDDDEEQPDLFGEGADLMNVLAGMQELGRQPFEVLASRKRMNRRQRRAAEEQEEEEEEEEEEGEEGEGEEEAEEGEGTQVPKAGAAGHGGRGGGGRAGRGRGRGRGRRQRGGAGVFGAAVDDIWNEQLAEQMGLQPAKNRKKQRARANWRRQADKRGARRRDVPVEVASKLGEANLLYAMQQHHEAIALLMEVVRLAPNLPDPYHTLGLLHEAVGDLKKALDFLMIAAHLTPKDISLWRRLAQLSSDQALIPQAIYCYTQVLRRDREDLDARFDRAMLYADVEEHKKAIQGLEQVQAARPDHSEVPKAMARLLHRTGQAGKAIEVLRAHIANHPDKTDLTHINILAELYCDGGLWAEALAVVEGAERKLLGPDEELPIDLTVKAATAHAFLGDAEAAAEAFGAVLREPVESFCDLYQEAGYVLMRIGQPSKALPFYSGLANSPEVGTHESWAQLAECHRAMDDPQGAVNVYQTVVHRLGPNNPAYTDAVVALADLHKELGQQQEAERVLGQLDQLIRMQDMPSDHAAALEFVLRRANVLYACGKNEEYLDVAVPVLGATLRALEAEHRQGPANEQDAKLAKRLKYLGGRRDVGGAAAGDAGGVFVGYKRYDRRKQHVRELDERAQQILAAQAAAGGAMSGAESDGEEEAGPSGFVMRELLRDEAPFMLLVQTGQVLLAERLYQEARELLQAAVDVCGKRWADKWKKDALRLLIFEAALGQRDFTAAMQNLRPVAHRWPYSTLVWNGFGRYLGETGAVRAALKFLAPQRQRHPSCLPLMLLLGHCHLLNTQYAEALGEYFHAYRIAPAEPLVLLCISAGLVNQAATKQVPDRHRAVLQAFAFLQEYSDVRCNAQEAAYNIGRAAHHLGLLHIAVPYYERALEAAPPPTAAGAGSAFDLRREAAYNLSLIYRQSGADGLAKQLLRQHLRV